MAITYVYPGLGNTTQAVGTDTSKTFPTPGNPANGDVLVFFFGQENVNNPLSSISWDGRAPDSGILFNNMGGEAGGAAAWWVCDGTETDTTVEVFFTSENAQGIGFCDIVRGLDTGELLTNGSLNFEDATYINTNIASVPFGPVNITYTGEWIAYAIQTCERSIRRKADEPISVTNGYAYRDDDGILFSNAVAGLQAATKISTGASATESLTFNAARTDQVWMAMVVFPAPAGGGNEAPTITTDPQSQTITVGQTATFTSAATGTPEPTAQWQINTGGGFADIAGATAASYTTPATTLADDGNQYHCVWTNSEGSETSAAATLTVNPVVSAVIPKLMYYNRRLG